MPRILWRNKNTEKSYDKAYRNAENKIDYTQPKRAEMLLARLKKEFIYA